MMKRKFAVEEEVFRDGSKRVFVYPQDERLYKYCSYGDHEIFHACSLDNEEGLKWEIAKWFFPEHFEWMNVTIVLTDMFWDEI